MIKSTYWFFFAGLLLLSEFSCAQSGAELAPGYYVTVAVYAKERQDYAQRFVESLAAKGNKVDYGFNGSRDLYFVYLEFFGDLKHAVERMQAVRKEGVFEEAWVRVIPGYIKNVATSEKSEIVSSKPTPVQGKKKELISSEPVQPPTPKQEPEEVVPSKEPTPPPVVGEVQEEPVEEKIIQHDPMTLGNTDVFFSLFNATNNRIVEGDVQVIDTERGKLLNQLKGNEYLKLPDPQSSTGQVSVIADVFGYRKIQHELNYKEPLEDTSKVYVDLMGTTFIVYFDLVRYRRGDISTLYHVYFLNDAAIMLAISGYELNSLLDLMKENDRYRIKLHGHTNGNYHGKIISLGPDKNFFSLDGSTQTIGSAKDLSYQRALTIKEYLITNGISANRIEIKAWGGKRPLYDKGGVSAKKNVRVEVEVLQE